MILGDIADLGSWTPNSSRRNVTGDLKESIWLLLQALRWDISTLNIFKLFVYVFLLSLSSVFLSWDMPLFHFKSTWIHLIHLCFPMILVGFSFPLHPMFPRRLHGNCQEAFCESLKQARKAETWRGLRGRSKWPDDRRFGCQPYQMRHGQSSMTHYQLRSSHLSVRNRSNVVINYDVHMSTAVRRSVWPVRPRHLRVTIITLFA